MVARIGDDHGIPIVVSRTGYTGELGFEVFCHPDDAPAVWDAIWAAGEPKGLTPLGLEALDGECFASPINAVLPTCARPYLQ